MSLAAFLPLRSPYPHQRSPPDTFSPRVHFSPRPVLAPMSRVPRIETAPSSRRVNNLPRDPSDWVDKDLLSYVRYNYSPIEAVPLSEVIERDRLTPTALWYLQAEPEQLLMIAEEESLRDTLLGLALSLKPAVSPTSPRIRHVRRLSEDLEHPPPPPPPPPPSPPTPEEPELEEDDDVAESVVSDWALDEDLDGDHGPTPTMDDLDDLAEAAAQPEPPVDGLGLHTGEPHLDDVTTPQPQPSTMETDDLINLEDDPQPTMPQEEVPEPHATRADTGAADDPQVEEPTSSQSASTDAHVPDVAGEKPPPGRHHHADPPAPLDEPSASSGAGASMPADPYGGSSSFTSPIEDDDLGNPLGEDASGAESSTPSRPTPPPPPADPPRTATPTSDYHDANSIHSDEGERQETLTAEQEPEPSPVHPEERVGPATSGDGVEDKPTTEAPLSTETSEKGETVENTSSGEGAPTHEEAQLEENTSSEDPIETPSSAADPIETTDLVQPTDPVQLTDPAQTAEPVHGSPPVTDTAGPSPPVTDPVTAPHSETTETQEERVSPAGGPERDETAQVGSDGSKDTQPEEPPVQSTTSGVTSSERSEETVEPEGRESGHLSGEDDANKAHGETVDKVDQEAVGEVGKDEEATVPPITTTEPAETTVPPAATTHTVNDSPLPEESSDKDASDVQANEQASSSETPAAQPEVDANSSSPAQDEDTPEKPSIPSEPSAAESTASPLLVTDTTPATTAISAPPSPTVRLASGIEAQLVNLDPESTEQTPSASPSDTPPDASSSPSESRQASPPAETQAEKQQQPPLTTRVRIPSSSSSSVLSVNPAEKKAPLDPIKTAFEPTVSRAASTPVTTSRSVSFGSQHPAWNQGMSPAAQKPPAWGSAAQSPAGKAKSLFSTLTSSVSSFAFGSHSEPTTPSVSRERVPPAPRAPAAPPSNRQLPGAGQGPWGQKRNWSTVASPPSGQQPSKSSLPSLPALESSNSASSAPAPNSIPVKPASVPQPLPAAESTIQMADREGKETTEALSDSVVVDSGVPSARNGEPAENEKTSRDHLVQPSVTAGGSSDSDKPSRRADADGGEDEDIVDVTPHDIAEASKEAGSDPIGGDDDDDDAPLDRRLAHVRQTTADSAYSAVTADTETQGEDERPSRPKGPKVETTNLSQGPEGIGSPILGDSPAVGSPSTTLSEAEKRRQKKARQKANKSARGR